MNPTIWPTAWRKLISGAVLAAVFSILFAANLAEGTLQLTCVPLFLLGLVYMGRGLRLLGETPVS